MHDTFVDSLFEYLNSGDGYDYESMTTDIMSLSDDHKEMASAILAKFADVVDDIQMKSRLKITINELKNEFYSFT